MAVADGAETPEAALEPLAARHLGLVAAVATVLVALDQLSKWWAVDDLSDGHSVALVGGLQFRLRHNAGAAFSIGDSHNLGPLIALLAIVVIVVLVLTGSTTRSRIGAVSVGLVAGGALGNIGDRVFRQGSGFLGGHVVDFIYTSWWPTFNVADSAICVGAVLLVIFGFRTPATSPPPG